MNSSRCRHLEVIFILSWTKQSSASTRSVQGIKPNWLPFKCFQQKATIETNFDYLPTKQKAQKHFFDFRRESNKRINERLGLNYRGSVSSFLDGSLDERNSAIILFPQVEQVPLRGASTKSLPCQVVWDTMDLPLPLKSRSQASELRALVTAYKFA